MSQTSATMVVDCKVCGSSVMLVLGICGCCGYQVKDSDVPARAPDSVTTEPTGTSYLKDYDSLVYIPSDITQQYRDMWE